MTLLSFKDGFVFITFFYLYLIVGVGEVQLRKLFGLL